MAKFIVCHGGIQADRAVAPHLSAIFGKIVLDVKTARGGSLRLSSVINQCIAPSYHCPAT